jgi:hypothetical protein
MQVQVISGIYTNGSPDYRTSYPVNLVPVPKSQGVSQSYLRPAPGIELHGTGPGVGRGGIVWNDVCYRVLGTKLCSISSAGVVVQLATIPGTGRVTMDYSFDRLAISGNGALFYWDGATLTQVTDSDLGTVLDFKWIDGYFMTTDGVSLVVTELNDPTSVNPLKYGSAERDPDGLVGIQKLHGEVYAIGRYTIEVFNNIGGEFFPFQRNQGAFINRGAVGAHACCVFDESIAFVGGARNESPAIWLGVNSRATKISSREVDILLAELSEDNLKAVVLETKVDRGGYQLFVHLVDRTLVYDSFATAQMQQPIWFVLASGTGDLSRYRAIDLLWCYGRWLVSDPVSVNLGRLTDTISTHYGNSVRWEVNTQILYPGGLSAIVHAIELVALTGSVVPGSDPVVWTSYSNDGETWSQEVPAKVGVQGNRAKRIKWIRQGHVRNWRVQKFRGLSESNISFAAVEMTIEALNA